MTGLFKRAVPAVFVLFWASGFVVARLVRPYAEPLSFVAARFIIGAPILVAIALLGGARWPDWRGWRDGLIAGALMQGIYVGTTFWAVKHGLPAALAALISGLQPLLTALLATPLLGEPVGRRRWAGIAIGFLGAALVLAPNMSGKQAVPPAAVAACVCAMIAMTLGTIWQKRIGGAVDLRSSAAIQLIGGLLVLLLPIAILEHGRIGTAPDVWIGLAWAVVILSVSSTLLLLSLIKAGEVARVTALFYLVPPVTALMAFALFGEALVPLQFVGMGLAAVGVAIANRGGAPLPAVE